MHRVIALIDGPRSIHYDDDDEVGLNTQSSSQQGSLLHQHHQPGAAGCNGTRTSKAELEQTKYVDRDIEMKLPLLQHWHKKGSLVARGVLLDYKRWASLYGEGDLGEAFCCCC